MWLNVLTAPAPRPWLYYPSQMTQAPLASAATSRIRVSSESQAATVSREEELQGNGEDEAGTPTDGAPFRGRSRSAPPALWAAQKYGRQLRRMSDEFDSLLDKGVSGAKAELRPPFKGVFSSTLCFPTQGMRKTHSAGTAKQMHHSRSWWSYLFSHQETESENNHHDSHTHRTE